MKRFLFVFLLASIFILFPHSAFAHYDLYEDPKPLTIHIDGVYLPSDVPPYIDSGRTLVPLRAGAEGLGATVVWDGQRRTATITKDDKTIVFTADRSSFLVNGVQQHLDVALQIKNGRTMLPLRAFGEALDVKVKWINGVRDVAIETGAPMFNPVFTKQQNDDTVWIFRKYYVSPKEGTPVGSWQREYEEKYDQNVSRIGEYLFISELSKGKYQVISVFINNHIDSNPEYYSGTYVTIDSDIAQATDGGFQFTVSNNIVYRYGPNDGWGDGVMGRYDFSVSNGKQLVRTGLHNTALNEYEALNDVFTPLQLLS